MSEKEKVVVSFSASVTKKLLDLMAKDMQQAQLELKKVRRQ